MQREPSAFDSRHYGLAVARLLPAPDAGLPALEAALAAARTDGVDLLVLRLDAAHPLHHALAAAGRTSVDRLVTSVLAPGARLPLTAPPDVALEHHARLEDPADHAAIAEVTHAFERSHLYADPRLPVAQTRALYREWAHNDVTGRAVRTTVARVAGVLAGYVTVIATPGGHAIDLVAVRASHQGRGIGAAMIAAVTAWLDAQPGSATVGTQADNPALALYARAGFVRRDETVTYHLWLDEAAP